jgi:hypothetical protein
MKRCAGACVGFATALLALGNAGVGHWIGAALAVALGCFWLIGLHRSWSGIEALGLVGFVAIAATELGTAVAAPVLLASVVAALAAWDLHRFALRLDKGSRVPHKSALVRSHIRWSLGVAGVGLLVSLAAPAIQIALPFGATLLLSALAVLGLSRAIRWLNRPS